MIDPTTISTKGNALLRYSLAGEGNALQQEAQQQVPLLANLKLFGQTTVWYGAPNTGKTLLALSLLLKAISDKRIEGSKVFYVNADDSSSGMARKASILDDVGAHTNRSYRLAALWNLPGSNRNPVASVAKPKYNNQRTCPLSPQEVDRLLKACEVSHNPLLKPIIQLLLATAARKRELLNARIEHIDLDRALWTIPQTKNGHPRTVPLSAAAVAVIKGLTRPSGNPWLLPNPATGKPFDNIKRSWKTACKQAGLPGMHLHDIRHAAIGAMVSQNVSLHVAGKIAGHLRPESTARYAHIADTTLASAVEAGSSNLGL